MIVILIIIIKIIIIITIRQVNAVMFVYKLVVSLVKIPPYSTK